MIKEGLGKYSIYWKTVPVYLSDIEKRQTMVNMDVMKLNSDRNSAAVASLMLIW